MKIVVFQVLGSALRPEQTPSLYSILKPEASVVLFAILDPRFSTLSEEWSPSREVEQTAESLHFLTSTRPQTLM